MSPRGRGATHTGGIALPQTVFPDARPLISRNLSFTVTLFMKSKVDMT